MKLRDSRLVVVFAALALAAPSGAQESRRAPSEPAGTEALPTRDEEALLRARNRNTLHPGEPLELAPRGVRSESDPAPVQVDVGASRERALAMYEARAEFHVPLANAVTEEDAPRADPAPRGARPAPLTPLSATHTDWAWFAGILGFLFVAAWYLRREPAPRGRRGARG